MTNRYRSEFDHRTISDFVASLAAGSPTPGGGSAAGVAGAMGCALGAMVCNLTLAKRHDVALQSLTDRLTAMASQLTELAAKDELAFANYRLAISRVRSTDEERDARRAGIESALVGAAEVPLQMIEAGSTAIDCLRQVAELGTPHALGDLSTGGFLLEAMSRGALENVDANASAMKVAANRDRFEVAARAAKAELENDMCALRKAIEARRRQSR